MKKFYLMMAAVSALALTACTSEDDFVQDAPTTQVAADQAVGFDVYTPAVTNATRAGLEGTMTTSRLQRSEYEGGGFGVYAFLTQDAIVGSGDGVNATAYASTTSPTANVPNFMVNEKLLWNATNQGWYYNPLKYWPNETDNDSQTSAAEMLGDGTNNHLDRLTFFAYAPYVKAGEDEIGITHLTNKGGYLDTDPEGTSTTTSTTDPTIGYKASLDDPNKAVDLLWGVAPAGGLTYTAVNGRTVNVEEGMPLIDMTKPDVNTNMKFLFQHALARIGVTAVAAVDQVGAGGKLDPNTKITIEKITMTGYFGETGYLNLNNTLRGAGVANWINANGIDLASATFESDAPATDLKKKTLVLAANHTNPENGTIATHLQFVGTPGNETDPVGTTPSEQTDRVGVTTVRQNVIQPALINNAPGENRNWVSFKHYAANELAYSETTPYYTTKDCNTKHSATITATTAAPVYTVNDKGVYTEYTSNVTLTYPNVNNYYNVKFKKVVADDATPDDATEIKLTAAKGKQSYKKISTTYTPDAVGIDPAVNSYIIDGKITKASALYATEGDYYKRDANYFMVVPTNNFVNMSGLSANEEKLRTVRVKVWYYITTEDSKLKGLRSQTKNVITKDVVFPSIANGKSYNLNLILGLTSVKMEAEVDDWKVINVNADLPQNTAE